MYICNICKLILCLQYLNVVHSFGFNPITSFFKKLIKYNYYSNDKNPVVSNELMKVSKIDRNEISEQMKYDLQWYVIGKPDDFSEIEPKKVSIWNKHYVVWRGNDTLYRALSDVCPHKGASLSGGKIIDDNVMCPYHGYEFNKDGILTKIPGICFQHSQVHDVYSYPIVEKNGWVYLNTYEKANKSDDTFFFENIYDEPEANSNFSLIQLQMDFKCYSRILSENSLDVMHIGFVHTFGNKVKPAPILEVPPASIGNYHYRTSYLYESGSESMAKKVFQVNQLKIENEFILPHTTVARVIFGDYISTIITFALPVNDTNSILYVKTYRNFWRNAIGDALTYKMMHETILQDKAVVENIHTPFMDGKFNMKFDKLQNTYKSFYKKLIHNFDNKKN